MNPSLSSDVCAKQRLARAVRSNRLTHALLLIGHASTTKEAFALYTAQLLLCPVVRDSGASKPCLACSDCQKILAHTHPQVQMIMTAREMKQRGIGAAESLSNSDEIRIEQIRHIKQAQRLSVGDNEQRIWIICDAHKLTQQAANALLKTLEEPPVGHTFILSSPQTGALYATIESRCQSLYFGAETKQASSEATEWFNRLLNISLEQKQTLLEEIMRSDKEAVLEGISVHILHELKALPQLGASQRSYIQALEASLSARSALLEHQNPQLVLENWLFSKWPL